MAPEPRGAGSAGGLLFVAVLLFLAYLVVTTLAGILKWLIAALFILVVVGFAIRVVSRRR